MLLPRRPHGEGMAPPPPEDDEVGAEDPGAGSSSAAGGVGGSARKLRASTRLLMAGRAHLHDSRKLYGTEIDGDDDEQLTSHSELVREELAHRRCLARPDSAFRQIWDGVQVVLLLYVAVVTPTRVGYDIPVPAYSGEFWWEAVVDLYFWLDIILNFRTAVFDERGELVIEGAEIRRQYYRTWFLPDLVSCLPVAYIELLLAGNISDNATTAKAALGTTSTDTNHLDCHVHPRQSKRTRLCTSALSR